MKIVLIVITALVELYTLIYWYGCKTLANIFTFSTFDAKLKIDDAVHNDVGFSTNIVRIFHNKAQLYTSEVFNKYINFWDIHFIVLFFTLIGCFGIVCGFWYLLNKNKRTYKVWLLFLGLLILPFIEILPIQIPNWLKVIIILIPYYILSLFGIWQFLRQHKRIGIVIIIFLIIISIWYMLVFQKDIFDNFCYN